MSSASSDQQHDKRSENEEVTYAPHPTLVRNNETPAEESAKGGQEASRRQGNVTSSDPLDLSAPRVRRDSSSAASLRSSSTATGGRNSSMECAPCDDRPPLTPRVARSYRHNGSNIPSVWQSERQRLLSQQQKTPMSLMHSNWGQQLRPASALHSDLGTRMEKRKRQSSFRRNSDVRQEESYESGTDEEVSSSFGAAVSSLHSGSTGTDIAALLNEVPSGGVLNDPATIDPERTPEPSATLSPRDLLRQAPPEHHAMWLVRKAIAAKEASTTTVDGKKASSSADHVNSRLPPPTPTLGQERSKSERGSDGTKETKTADESHHLRQEKPKSGRIFDTGEYSFTTFSKENKSSTLRKLPGSSRSGRLRKAASANRINYTFSSTLRSISSPGDPYRGLGDAGGSSISDRGFPGHSFLNLSLDPPSTIRSQSGPTRLSTSGRSLASINESQDLEDGTTMSSTSSSSTRKRRISPTTEMYEQEYEPRPTQYSTHIERIALANSKQSRFSTASMRTPPSPPLPMQPAPGVRYANAPIEEGPDRKVGVAPLFFPRRRSRSHGTFSFRHDDIAIQESSDGENDDYRDHYDFDHNHDKINIKNNNKPATPIELESTVPTSEQVARLDTVDGLETNSAAVGDSLTMSQQQLSSLEGSSKTSPEPESGLDPKTPYVTSEQRSSERAEEDDSGADGTEHQPLTLLSADSCPNGSPLSDEPTSTQEVGDTPRSHQLGSEQHDVKQSIREEVLAHSRQRRGRRDREDGALAPQPSTATNVLSAKTTRRISGSISPSTASDDVGASDRQERRASVNDAAIGRSRNGSEPGVVEVRRRAFGPPPAWAARESGQNGASSLLGDAPTSEPSAETAPLPLQGNGNEAIQAEPIAEEIVEVYANAEAMPSTLKLMLRDRPLTVCLVVSVFALVVVAVALSVSFTVSPFNGGNEPGLSPTSSTTISMAPSSSAAPTIEADTLLEALTAISPEGRFNESGSPQYRTLEWLMERKQPSFDYQDPQFLQRYAAAILYFSTDGDNWIVKDNWLDPELDVCAWSSDHIECEAVAGRNSVVSLLLGGNGLRGTLPPELRLFGALETLDVCFNALGGTLPFEVGELERLEHLDVRSNSITGTIPIALENATKLRHMDIAKNGVSGSIPPGFGDLKNLEYLDLHMNNMEGRIPVGLFALDNLYWLHLGGNPFNGTLPSLLSLSIEYLGLWRTALNGTLPSSIGDWQNLEFFDVHYCQLSGTLPRTIGGMRSLEYLDIGGNGFSGTLPTEIGKLQNLSSLFLWENALSGIIPQEIGGLGNLARLDGHYNSFEGSIPSQIGKLTEMALLDFGGNGLVGRIPSEVQNLTKLSKIALWRNSLVGNIPPGLAVRNLGFLDLHYNFLSGSIPSTIWKLDNLGYLDLGGNRLAGALPQEVGNSSSLRSLFLWENALTSSIPSTIAKFSELETLDIRHNRFSGTVPSELGSISGLQKLLIQDNQLTGSVPETICKLDLGALEADCENELNCTCCSVCA